MNHIEQSIDVEKVKSEWKKIQRGREMSFEVLHETEDFKHDPFQAFWDFEFDFKQENQKNQNEQSFNAAWNYQQSKIDKLEKLLGEAEKELKFYKDEASWEIPDIDPITVWGGMSSKSSIEHDRGKRAREYFKNKEKI